MNNIEEQDDQQLREALRQSYQDAATLFSSFASDKTQIDKTLVVSSVIAKAFQEGNKVLICGNGGSCCDAIHFAEEFTGRFRKNRKALPVIALSDSAHITCVGNDFGFDEIFSRSVEAYGKTGDIFIGISTSGNSENVLRAASVANQLGLLTLSLLGRDGGKLAGVCDYEFIIPGQSSDRIQELHMAILHILIEGVERILFPENYSIHADLIK